MSLALELEHKAYWVVRELNRDFKLAVKKRFLALSSFDEWRSEAYENVRLFKEKVKKWHDRRILKREFNVGEHVPVSDFLQENYSLNGKDLMLLWRYIVQVLSKLPHSKMTLHKW